MRYVCFCWLFLALAAPVAAQPVLASSSSYTAAASGQSCAIPRPSGLAPGDLMIATCGFRATSGNYVVTPPNAGWTTIQEGWQSATIDAETWWKIADANDATTITFNFTTTAAAVAVVGGMVRITGHHATAPIYASAECGKSAGTTTLTCPDMTPSVIAVLLLWVHIHGDGDINMSTWAVAVDDPVWTEAFDVISMGGADAGMAMATALRASMNATGAWTSVQSIGRPAIGHVIMVASSGTMPAAPISMRLLLTGGF